MLRGEGSGLESEGVSLGGGVWIGVRWGVLRGVGARVRVRGGVLRGGWIRLLF